MNEKEIYEYQKIHKPYYPTVPSLKTNCPINYDWENCSSSEYGYECRTCCNYNPLRMLYETTVNKTKLGVPEEVLYGDCRIQLKHESR